jgi:hypothetical protein
VLADAHPGAPLRPAHLKDRPQAYGARTLTSFLNPAAFSYPPAGTLGDHRINSIERPVFWTTGDRRIMQVGFKFGF